MRPTVKQAAKFMQRALERLEQTGSTTVSETTALLQAQRALQQQIMRCGLRAREALRREDEEKAKRLPA